MWKGFQERLPTIETTGQSGNVESIFLLSGRVSFHVAVLNDIFRVVVIVTLRPKNRKKMVMGGKERSERE